MMWLKDISLQRDWYNFAELRLFIAKAIYRKEARISDFEAIVMKNDNSRRRKITCLRAKANIRFILRALRKEASFP